MKRRALGRPGWAFEFELTAAEKIVFPHLKDMTHFMLTYCSDGFVIGNSKNAES